MCVWSVFLVFVTLRPAPHQKGISNVSISDGCIEETGVTSEALFEARRGHFGDDEGLKKYIYCCGRKADIVTSDGNLNMEIALTYLPPVVNKDVARILLEDCKSQTGKDATDKVYEIFVTLRPAPHQKGISNVSISDGCIEETGVTSEALFEARRGHFGDDKGLKKYIYCCGRKADIVTSDGNLNMEVALTFLPPYINKDVAKRLLERCKSQTGKDATDKVYEIVRCLYPCN